PGTPRRLSASVGASRTVVSFQRLCCFTASSRQTHFQTVRNNEEPVVGRTIDPFKSPDPGEVPRVRVHVPLVLTPGSLKGTSSIQPGHSLCCTAERKPCRLFPSEPLQSADQ
ncbi:hypothetical protein KUCAC02_031403, partial [Chaenocephalus aceratus]